MQGRDVSATIAVTPTYTYGGTSCTGTAKTFTIYVNPTGLVTQPADLYVCNTGTGTVTFATTNTGAGTTTYAWTNSNTGIGLGASGAGNISFTATNAGTVPDIGDDSSNADVYIRRDELYRHGKDLYDLSVLGERLR